MCEQLPFRSSIQSPIINNNYNLFQNQKSTNILPRKYIRQRRRLLFLVCLQVSEKSGVMRENCWS
jgi:hypothetical protein